MTVTIALFPILKDTFICLLFVIPVKWRKKLSLITFLNFKFQFQLLYGLLR